MEKPIYGDFLVILSEMKNCWHFLVWGDRTCLENIVANKPLIMFSQYAAIMTNFRFRLVILKILNKTTLFTVVGEIDPAINYIVYTTKKIEDCSTKKNNW